MDPFTGATVWTFTRAGANFQTAPTKIDNTYMFLDGDSGAGGLGYNAVANTITNETVTVLKTNTGEFVSNFTIIGVGFQPGAGGYFPGRYDPESHMKLVRGYNVQTNELSYYAINLTDPTAPKQAWKTVLDESGEELSVGGGLALVGTVNGAILAFNITTGNVVWRTQKVGFAQYSATYIAADNTFIQGSASTTLTCYDATNGHVLWDKPQGGRAFFAFAGATAYGRFYQHNIAVPEGFIGCWDVQTGDMLWRASALYNIGYITPIVADGKVFLQRFSGTAAGVATEGNAFDCYDAYTGDLLWEIPGASIVHPSVAYGNLYCIVGSSVYCYSDKNPVDWNMWRANNNSTGISQSTGPYGNNPNGFTPVANFACGPTTSSPAVVAGKVYFGSQDKNIYCVDAFNASKIWNYTTNYRVFSSPAVVGDKVFTGADDGNVYALNAQTGAKLWSTPVGGGLTNYVFAATWQARSSPLIVGNSLYVGALDGRLYCLDTSSGNIQWSVALGNATFPIAGSPATDNNGFIYICATNHNLYKINGATGVIIWTTTSNATIARAYTNYFPWSTPVIFNNTVYWGAGPVYGRLIWYALNATDGKQRWNVNGSSASVPTNTTFAGNTPTCQTPVIVPYNSSLTVMIVGEWMGVSIRNANNGNLIWYQFLGHEVYSSVAYANDTRTPKFYIGSDTYSVTCFNMTAAVRNDSLNAILASYTTLSHIQSSPSIWDGKLYVTSADGHLYIFEDKAKTDFDIYVAASKAGTMWNNETLVLVGKLRPLPTTTFYGSYASNGLPNATVEITFVKPDGTSVNYTATTGKVGQFELDANLTDVGTWSWIVFYSGADHPLITYNPTYTQYSSIDVAAAPIEATPTPTPVVIETPTPIVTETPLVTASPTVAPTSTAAPDTTMYIYAVVAVIIIIAVAAYMFTRGRGKKA